MKYRIHTLQVSSQMRRNPRAYFKTLGPELWDALNGEINIFVAGAGTGGTFMGTASYLKEKI